MLVETLEDKRRNFAGIGTRKAKLRLNKLADVDPVADATRLALEIEDVNIQAKKYFGEWRGKNYGKKEVLIDKLCDVFRKQAWTGYGIQANEAAHPSHIVYFDILGCEQVSFHFGPANPKRYPRYQGEWDGKEFSTLDKLEEAAVALFEKHEKGGAGEVGDEGVAA